MNSDSTSKTSKTVFKACSHVYLYLWPSRFLSFWFVKGIWRCFTNHSFFFSESKYDWTFFSVHLLFDQKIIVTFMIFFSSVLLLIMQYLNFWLFTILIILAFDVCVIQHLEPLNVGHSSGSSNNNNNNDDYVSKQQQQQQ